MEREVPVSCEYPGCDRQDDLRACQKLDSRRVCPEHREVVNGAVRCLVCRERIAALLASQSRVIAEAQESTVGSDRRLARDLLKWNLAGFIPYLVAVAVTILFVEIRFGSGYREFYPIAAIGLLGGFLFEVLFRGSETSARPDDFGSGWRAGTDYSQSKI